MRYLANFIFLFFCSFSDAQVLLLSHRLSDCNPEDYETLVRKRIVSKTVSNDTLSLRIGFMESCCGELKPEFWQSNDTLYLTMHNLSDIFCPCNCCYEMAMQVSDISDTNFVLMWGDFVLKTESKYPKLPHEYEFNDKTPVNQLNAEGLKVGLWREENKNGFRIEIYYGINPRGESLIIWRRVYDKKGKLKQIAVGNGQSEDLFEFEPEFYSKFFEKQEKFKP